MISRRDVLRAPIGLGLGLGVGCGGSGVPFPSIPLSFWASGGYWDLSTLTGSHGTGVVAGNSALTSLSNAALLVPSTTVAPAIWDNQVIGRRAAQFKSSNTGANETYFTCNALATLFQGTPAAFTVAMHVRQARVLNMPYWTVLRGDGSATEQLFGRQTSEKYALSKHTTAGGTVTKTGSALLDPYGDMIVVWVWDGTNVNIYYAASADTTPRVDVLGAYDTNSFTASLNRFTFMSSVSSVPFEGANGYLGKCAVSSSALSSGQVATLVNQWRSSGYLTTQSSARCVSYPGDSETLGAQDSLLGAGRRGVFAQFCYDNALSFYTVSTAPGVRAGSIGNTFSSSSSGQTISQIQTSTLADIAAAPSPIRFADICMGDGDNNAGTPTNTMIASYHGAYVAIMNAGIARDPLFRIAVTTLPPISPSGGTIDLGITAFNAALPAEWNTLDGLYPNNKAFRWDAHTATGTVWSAQFFSADLAHPNRLGLLQEALDPVSGLLWASDGTTRLGVWLRANSPSVPRPIALTGTITSPAPAWSSAHGSPLTITGNCSRLGAKAVVTLASQGGIAMWAETYDIVVSFGGNDITPDPQWSITLTPPIGDVGAQTINVAFTDVDGVTTASAAVSGTVT